MAIKTQFLTQEEIPEALREHAVEVDGKWVVEVTDIESHPKVNKLRNAYTKEKEKRDAQAAQIADLQVKIDLLPEDFDAERWVQLKLMESKAVDPEKQKEAIKKELEQQRIAVKADLEKAHAAEKATLEANAQKLKNFLEKTIKQDRLREGLVAAGVAKEFLAGAMALLQTRITIVEDGDDFKDVVETDMGEISAKEYALQWVQKDEGKPYVKPASGPVLKPGDPKYTVNNGDNPWAVGSINLTQQGIILKGDPQKAARLKLAAGIKEA